MKGKKAYFIKNFIFVLFLIFNSALVSQQLHKDSNYGFVITIPDGWKITKGGSMIPLFAHQGAYNSLTVNVQKNEIFRSMQISESNVDTLKMETEKLLSGMFKGFKTLDYGITILDGRNTFFIIYNYEVPNAILWFSQYMFVIDDKQFFISAGCLNSEKETLEPVLKETVNSFAFVK
jgi:hypothetical protein